MMARTMDELRELAPGYVMDTLDPNERAAFEAALASSPELAADVADQRAVVEALATEHSVPPPPSLRDALLQRIAADRAVSPVHRPVTSRAPLTSRRWLSPLVVTGLAAALVFAIVGGRQAAALRDSQLATLRDSMRAHDAVLADVQGKLHQRDTALNTIVGAESGLIVVDLAGGTVTGPGAQLFWNPKQGRGVLHAFRLTAATTGRAYQLWLIRDGKAIPVRVFNTDPNGHGLVTGFSLPREAKGVSAATVTEEPAGGSSQPTSSPVIRGGLARTR